MKKNAVVGQSGGPTAVINASLYGTVYEALNREDEIGTVYGMINGIEGFLNDQVMDMAPLEESKELELILDHTRLISWLLPIQASGRSQRSGLSTAFCTLRSIQHRIFLLHRRQ